VTDSLTKITELSFGAISDLANISFETLKTTLSSVSDVLKTISSTAVDLVDVSFKGLKDVIEAIGNSVTNMTNSVTGLVRELKELVKAVNEGMSALNPFSGGGGSSGGGGGESTAGRIAKGILTGGLSELFHWATGTNNAPAGLSLVGEAGPELVKFRGGEQVLNNRNTNKALANMGGNTNNFNVTFNNLQDTSAFAMIQQLKQYNRQMAINGVI
jgi:phage-related tail protein